MITPNDCVRFTYGQGCHDCHNYMLCWPCYTTSTYSIPCEHAWRLIYEDSAGRHVRCDKCGEQRDISPYFGGSVTWQEATRPIPERKEEV